MSIRPATDIVLDVARAADPARYKQAAARLDATGGGDFAASLAAAATSGGPEAPASGGTAAPTAPMAQPSPDRPPPRGDTVPDKAATAYRQFEAMALANLLEAAMPANESFFGKGVAGDSWKSMLVDQIAGEMAKHGGVGIADELARAEAGRRQTSS